MNDIHGLRFGEPKGETCSPMRSDGHDAVSWLTALCRAKTRKTAPAARSDGAVSTASRRVCELMHTDAKSGSAGSRPDMSTVRGS